MTNTSSEICDWDVIPEKGDLCEPYEGMILSDNGWPDEVKIVVYLLSLMWCFSGVAIISDVFMSSIEKVTSKKKLIRSTKTGKMITVKVWNDTVANLTLMALGSSAPEILLSLLELIGINNFKSGELGPSTIVGSAAFNLFCITAVCISSIPNGEVRKVKDTAVYFVTASFSIFAYFWLVFIVLVNSKDVISEWEGAATFMFFPMLVLIAYCADVFNRRMSGPRSSLHEVSEDELADLQMKIRQMHGESLTDEQVHRLIEYELSKHPLGCRQSRAKYLVASTRNLVGGKKVAADQWDMAMRTRDSLRPPGERTRRGSTHQELPSILFFAVRQVPVMESAGAVTVTVKRSGNLDNAVTVEYRTRDGNATAGSDYTEQCGMLEFLPSQDTKTFEIKIIDDEDHEDTEEFYVDLLNVECLTPAGFANVAPDKASITIVIIDDDEPGQLAFEQEQMEVVETASTQILPVKVIRSNGGCGRITCSYRTEDDSAVAGCDYSAAEGELAFEVGEIEKLIELEILPKGRYNGKESFRLVLENVTGGASFDASTDGGEDTCILTVSLLPSADSKDKADSVMHMLRINTDHLHIGQANWREQIVEAIYCGGSPEEQRQASWPGMAVHFVTLPWKLIFACVPPTDYAGGWLCFGCSLFMIACVTAIIGDLANLLGCAIPSFTPSITAITFVALGTSLPDTFASKSAAVQDPYADASIGNITGSNSVNVFLGLGLPWLIGAIYWRVMGATDEWKMHYVGTIPKEICKSGAFIVSSEGLSFSVLVFSTFALAALCLLYIRRRLCGGELGGSNTSAHASSACMVMFWVGYISLSIWNIQTNTF